MPYKFHPRLEALIALVNVFFPEPRRVRVLVENPLSQIKTVVVYARLSKADRREKKVKLSPQIQVDTCLQWAKAMRWNVAGMFDKDVGVGGRDFDRPDWQRMVEFIRKSKVHIDAIIVAKIDRFARSVVEGLTTLNELAEMDVVLRVAEMPYLAPENDDGWQSVVMGLVFAEMEVRNIRRRTKAVLRQKKLQGERTGGRFVSRMFKTDAENRIIPSETAERIAEMRAAGTSYGEIARTVGISKGEAYDACAFLAKLRAEGEAQTEAESSLTA